MIELNKHQDKFTFFLIYSKIFFHSFIITITLSICFYSHAEIYSALIEQIKKDRDSYYRHFSNQSRNVKSCLESINSLSETIAYSEDEINTEQALCDLDVFSREIDYQNCLLLQNEWLSTIIEKSNHFTTFCPSQHFGQSIDQLSSLIDVLEDKFHALMEEYNNFIFNTFELYIEKVLEPIRYKQYIPQCFIDILNLYQNTLLNINQIISSSHYGDWNIFKTNFDNLKNIEEQLLILEKICKVSNSKGIKNIEQVIVNLRNEYKDIDASSFFKTNCKKSHLLETNLHQFDDLLILGAFHSLLPIASYSKASEDEGSHGEGGVDLPDNSGSVDFLGTTQGRPVWGIDFESEESIQLNGMGEGSGGLSGSGGGIGEALSIENYLKNYDRLDCTGPCIMVINPDIFWHPEIIHQDIKNKKIGKKEKQELNHILSQRDEIEETTMQTVNDIFNSFQKDTLTSVLDVEKLSSIFLEQINTIVQNIESQLRNTINPFELISVYSRVSHLFILRDFPVREGFFESSAKRIEMQIYDHLLNQIDGNNKVKNKVLKNRLKYFINKRKEQVKETYITAKMFLALEYNYLPDIYWTSYFLHALYDENNIKISKKEVEFVNIGKKFRNLDKKISYKWFNNIAERTRPLISDIDNIEKEVIQTLDDNVHFFNKKNDDKLLKNILNKSELDLENAIKNSSVFVESSLLHSIEKFISELLKGDFEHYENFYESEVNAFVKVNSKILKDKIKSRLVLYNQLRSDLQLIAKNIEDHLDQIIIIDENQVEEDRWFIKVNNVIKGIEELVRRSVENSPFQYDNQWTDDVAELKIQEIIFELERKAYHQILKSSIQSGKKLDQNLHTYLEILKNKFDNFYSPSDNREPVSSQFSWVNPLTHGQVEATSSKNGKVNSTGLLNTNSLLKQEIQTANEEDFSYEFLSPEGKFLDKITHLYSKLDNTTPPDESGSRAKEIGLSAIEVADKAFSQGHTQEADLAFQVGETMADIAIGVTFPSMGFGKDIYELFTGQHLLTGRTLNTFERSMSAVGIALFSLTGGLVNSSTVRLSFQQTSKVLNKINNKLLDKTLLGLKDLQLNRVIQEYPKAFFHIMEDIGLKTKKELKSGFKFVKRAFAGDNPSIDEFQKALKSVGKDGIHRYNKALQNLENKSINLSEFGEEFLARQVLLSKEIYKKTGKRINQKNLVQTGKIYAQKSKDILSINPADLDNLDKIKSFIRLDGQIKIFRTTQTDILNNISQKAFKFHKGMKSHIARYTVGEEAVYTSMAKKTSQIEFTSQFKKQFLPPYETVSELIDPSKIDKVLDLTDSKVLKQLGLSTEDITIKIVDDPNAYKLTQVIGHIAKRKGFKGILAPSAPALKAGGKNFISFEEF